MRTGDSTTGRGHHRCHDVMPRTGEEWTVDDLDHLPDDGLQYELLDGLLLVSPAPVA